MTEIPEHLLRRAQSAREKAAAEPLDAGSLARSVIDRLSAISATSSRAPKIKDAKYRRKGRSTGEVTIEAEVVVKGRDWVVLIADHGPNPNEPHLMTRDEFDDQFDPIPSTKTGESWVYCNFEFRLPDLGEWYQEDKGSKMGLVRCVKEASTGPKWVLVP